MTRPIIKKTKNIILIDLFIRENASNFLSSFQNLVILGWAAKVIGKIKNENILIDISLIVEYTPRLIVSK